MLDPAVSRQADVLSFLGAALHGPDIPDLPARPKKEPRRPAGLSVIRPPERRLAVVPPLRPRTILLHHARCQVGGFQVRRRAAGCGVELAALRP